ncbi:hypothetical protein SDC9_202242 [bioreactor metagenome]|uniref:Uncharacterized protein n=1 Tax=bioreactor metagenome TaxID=1076179 RepID=A0A645IT49_9ZZZZ
MADVRHDGELFSVMDKRVSNRVRRVVRGGEGMHAELLEIEIPIRLKHADVLGCDLADAFRHVLPALRRGIDGNVIFSRKHADAGDVIGMFMGDQDRIQPLRAEVDHRHHLTQTLCGHARVYNQAHTARLQIGGIAGRTAAQR